MSAASLSPRSSEEPMAFTRDDLFRGAMRAWGAFLVLLLALEVVASVISDLSAPEGWASSNVTLLPVVLVMSLLIGGAISGLSLVIGIPIAHRIAKALRHQRRVTVHLSVFGLYGFGFGALVGGASYVLAFASNGWSLAQPAVIAAVIAGALTAVAVLFAWWSVARDALREERGVPRRRITRVDPDPAVEDSI